MIEWRLLLVAFALGACHEGSPTPSAGSNSNWLTGCERDTDCAKSTTCQCGSCTRVCGSEVDCSALAGARCVPNAEAAVRSMCRESANNSSLCLPQCEAGTCGAGSACVLGACVLASLPGNDFCGSVELPSDGERAREDELLDAAEQMRLQGGISCAGSAASVSGVALRFDARLSCAARVLATDLYATRLHNLTDSRGRTSPQRMSAAGYAPSVWAEGFAYGAASGSDALASMLSDASACSGLTNSRALDVGVAHVGDVDVVTVAAE